MMIVNHTLGFIFVSNPKAASTSIEVALSKYQEEDELNLMYSDGFFTKGHIPSSLLKKILGSKLWDSYLTFGVVRNPWSWFVSQYFYNISRLPISTKQKGYLTEEKIMHLYRFLSSKRGVEWETSGCQSSFLCERNGKILVKNIIKFENLYNDFNKILRLIGIYSPLQHLNKTNHKPYETYYTYSTAKLISKLYKNDIERFGYLNSNPCNSISNLTNYDININKKSNLISC